MESDEWEWPGRRTYIHYIAMFLSKYVNRAAMEFDGGAAGNANMDDLHDTVPVKVC